MISEDLITRQKCYIEPLSSVFDSIACACGDDDSSICFEEPTTITTCEKTLFKNSSATCTSQGGHVTSNSSQVDYSNMILTLTPAESVSATGSSSSYRDGNGDGESTVQSVMHFFSFHSTGDADYSDCMNLISNSDGDILAQLIGDGIGYTVDAAEVTVCATLHTSGLCPNAFPSIDWVNSNYEPLNMDYQIDGTQICGTFPGLSITSYLLPLFISLFASY